MLYCVSSSFSFDSLAALATKLPQNKEVREKTQQLDEERKALLRGWEQKDDFLRQTLDLQLFNKEADHIDAATSSQEVFLEYCDLGVIIASKNMEMYDDIILFPKRLHWMTWKLCKSDMTISKILWLFKTIG